MPFADLTLLDLLDERSKDQPDTVWLKDLHAGGSSKWTWREAQSEIQAVAIWLNNTLGLAEQKASILSRNRAHWVLADMAILASGNVSVPMFTTQSSSVAKYIFEFTDVKVLFVGEAENWAKIRDIIPKDIIIVTFPGVEIDVPSLLWEDLVSQFSDQCVQVESHQDDLISLVFTSGTTGMPKGVMQTHSSMILPVARYAPVLGIADKPKLISYLPLSHIAERQAIEVQSLLLGGEISFIESLPTLVRDLQRTRPTFFFGAPRVWESLQQGVYESFGGRVAYEDALADNKQAVGDKARAFLGFQEIDAALSGAAPLSTSILRFYDDLEIPILEAFGQTEAMSVIGNRKDERRLGSIGKPIGEVEARISDDGELLIRGSGFATGYYKQPEKTAETFVDGWLHTGDRARVDEDGFYFLTGRVKDYFKTIHGKFVAPVPIEDTFNRSPYIEQLCLMGRGCSKTAMVCVPGEEGKALSRQELANALRQLALSTNDSLDEKHTRIGVVLICTEPWTIENGFLTTTLKIKRPAIDEAFLDTVQPLATLAAEQRQIIVEWAWLL